MRAHELSHVERRKTLEQAGPDDCHEPGRDEQLRKPRERSMGELSALHSQPQPFAHRREHTRNDLAIVELGELGKTWSLRNDQPNDILAARAVNLVHERIEN